MRGTPINTVYHTHHRNNDRMGSSTTHRPSGWGAQVCGVCIRANRENNKTYTVRELAAHRRNRHRGDGAGRLCDADAVAYMKRRRESNRTASTKPGNCKMRLKCGRIATQLATRWDSEHPVPTDEEAAAAHRAQRAREVPTAEHVLAVWMLHLAPPTDERAEVAALLEANGLSPGAVVTQVLGLIRRSEERVAKRATTAAAGAEDNGSSVSAGGGDGSGTS